ncbi:MAG TPA: carboxymuconolactone decarboxylase family protein [Pseudonocardiaceae bacterium]|jgi:AhpD family alkylhydroperoxidase
MRIPNPPGVAEGTWELVGLRISQLNGCGECVYGHNQAAKQAGETEERLVLIAAWRDAPFFTDAERAALDLAESITRAAEHYDEQQLAALVAMITTVHHRPQ